MVILILFLSSNPAMAGVCSEPDRFIEKVLRSPSIKALRSEWDAADPQWESVYANQNSSKFADPNARAGVVGRLYEACTGAGVPFPVFRDQEAVMIEEIDFERPSARDELTLKAFVGSLVIEAYLCGTFFSVGNLESEVQRRVTSEQGTGLCADVNLYEVFIRHICKNPEARDGADPIETVSVASIDYCRSSESLHD